MKASPFHCRLTHHPTFALHQETCLSATRANPHLQPCTFKSPYQLLHSYLTPLISPSRVSPFGRTQTYASSACWMTYLFLWTVICYRLLSLCVPHIQPMTNPDLLPYFFSSTHMIAPESQLSLPLAFSVFWFPDCPALLPTSDTNSLYM